jgi:hypothetical protein
MKIHNKDKIFINILDVSLQQSTSMFRPIFIDEDKTYKHINWYYLSSNPNALSILEENIDKINTFVFVNNNHVIKKTICDILIKMYDYINDHDIHNFYVSIHPSLVPYLENNPEKIDWDGLSTNPNAIHLLEENPDKIVWNKLSRNPNAIHLLEENPDKIDWSWLSSNPNAIHLLEENPDKIDWYQLSLNPNAIHLLEQNPDKIMWNWLSFNPNAIHLLEQNIDKVSWDALATNKNPDAVRLFENNPTELERSIVSSDKASEHLINLLRNYPQYINWKLLNGNKYAIDLLEQNPDKINLFSLVRNENAVHLLEKYTNELNEMLCIEPHLYTISQIYANPNALHLIFRLDLNKMKKKCNVFFKELVEYVFEPGRIERMSNAFNMDMDEYLECI